MAKKPERIPSGVYRGPTRRLRVMVSERRWTVTKDTPVERMSLRRSLPRRATAAQSGDSFFEVVDRDGSVLYRQSIADPTRPGVELFDGDTIRRVGTPDRQVIVDVVVPDVPEGVAVRLVADGEELPMGKAGQKAEPGGYALKPSRGKEGDSHG